MRRPWRARTDLIDRADAVLESRRPRRAGATPAAALPHGDQRKLEVAMMMALEPKVYMFDEPTAGMSVDEVPVVLDLIARLKSDTTKTILLVEHKMDVVRSLADRIVVLINGELVADGDPATVIASPVVQEAYLGDRAGEGRMSAGLTLEGVHTHIGRYHILQGVDFDAPGGRTTMLLGRNGAGKTTALRTIMGLWRASKGRIALGDTRSTASRERRRPARRRLRARDDGDLLRPHGQGESGPRRARRARSTTRASPGSSASSRR